MDYCILVELSRKRITFSYYTGDIDKFEPYGDELVKPLAVWFSGNSVIVGTEAKREALKGTPNAFYDLFELMKQQNHFDYANEKHEYNKLILYTIRAGLKEFFRNVMLNSQGTLDENIAKLPLALIVGADIELNERNVLLNQLRDNGFGNVIVVEEEVYIIKSFIKDVDIAEQTSLILSSNGNHLYGNVYRGEKLVDTFTLKDAGKDPRVDKLANLIWERTQAEYAWLDREQEFPELRNAAARFIQSGDIQRDDSVTLSNGEEYPYYLTREDLNIYNQTDGGHITQEIVGRVVSHCKKQDCLVVLNDEAATNRYLLDLLSPEFPQLKIMDKGNKSVIYDMIVKSFKDMSFLFPQPHKKKISAAANTTVVTDAGTVTKRDERSFKMLEMYIQTYQHNGDKRNAMRDAQIFLDEMHCRNITQFDLQVEMLLSEFDSSEETVIAPLQPESNSPKSLDSDSSLLSVAPTPHDNREFRVIQKTVETALANKSIDKALQDIEIFLQAMKAKSVTAFDVSLQEMKMKLKNVVYSAKTQKVIPASTVKPTCDVMQRHATVKNIFENEISSKENHDLEKADRLMKLGKYKEARELYRGNSCKIQADDCTALIKWNRLLAQYKSEATTTAASRNVEKAKTRVLEIRQYVTLYRKYGIDTKELDTLLNEYKRIK